MVKPKGRTPTLLSMSTGKPSKHTCKKSSKCARCKEVILNGAICFQIPKQKSGFTSKPLFCISCTKNILEQTKADILDIEKAIEE